MQQCSKADIERIRRMERAFDQASRAVDAGVQDEETRENLRLLEEYVSCGQWLCDYALDEQGYWPGDLKRGVLSQDALYDLLTNIDREEK